LFLLRLRIATIQPREEKPGYSCRWDLGFRMLAGSA